MLVINEYDRVDFFQLNQVLLDKQNGKHVQYKQQQNQHQIALQNKHKIFKQFEWKNCKTLADTLHNDIQDWKQKQHIQKEEKKLLVPTNIQLKRQRDDQGTYMQFIPSQILDIRNVPDDFGDHNIDNNFQDLNFAYRGNFQTQFSKDVNYLINKYRDSREMSRTTTTYDERKIQKLEPLPALIRTYKVAGVKYEIIGDPAEHKVSYNIPVEQNIHSSISKIDSFRYYPGISQYKSTYTPISGYRQTQDPYKKTSTQVYYIKQSIQPAQVSTSLYPVPIIKNENNNLQYSNSYQIDKHYQNNYNILNNQKLEQSPNVNEKMNLFQWNDHNDYNNQNIFNNQKLEKSIITNEKINSSQWNDHNVYQKENSDHKIICETYENGQQYQGQKLNNMRHGKGQLSYLEGGRYDGEWKFNNKNGKGVLYSADGEPVYTGQWLEDKFDGEGVLVNFNQIPFQMELDYSNFDRSFKGNNWKQYKGTFRNDEKCGYGILEFTNGEQFHGMFKNDQANGEGIYINKNGKKINGTWINNRLQK